MHRKYFEYLPKFNTFVFVILATSKQVNFNLYHRYYGSWIFQLFYVFFT